MQPDQAGARDLYTSVEGLVRDYFIYEIGYSRTRSQLLLADQDSTLTQSNYVNHTTECCKDLAQASPNMVCCVSHVRKL